MGDELDLQVERTPQGAIVHARGEVDRSTAQELRQCLTELAGNVIVDLSGVTFLDSSGMSVFVVERKRLTRAGGDLRLRAPHDTVRRALEVTGLSALFTADQ
jgi:anti-anti-sigma factor